MRKLLLLLASLFFLMGSASSVAMAQDDDATPEGDDSEATGELNPVNPEIGDTITIIDDQGDPIGTITVNSIERGWDQYDEYSEPERGSEFVAFTITIENTIDNETLDLNSYGFSLQTQQGFFWSTSYASAEDAEPPLLDDDSLPGGETLEATIVFQVLEDEPLAHLFWQPQSGVFLTLANLDGE